MLKDFNRSAKAFNRSGATQAVALDIYPRVLTGFEMLVFFKWFWMGSLYE